MLSERRVIHMARMEMFRSHNQALAAPFINLDKRDYLSFSNMTGFIKGTVFYGIVAACVLTGEITVLAEKMTRELLVVSLITALVGYIVFIFLYRSWYYRSCMKKYQDARRVIGRMRRDWDTLEEIYQDEKEATRPTVDLDLLFPEGSLGENE